jgi:hypothetical protein
VVTTKATSIGMIGILEEKLPPCILTKKGVEVARTAKK